MAKQIKIGYDKTPAPITKQFIQLIDREGTPLFDDAGNPLVTEESAALTSLTKADNALSVHVNNNPGIPNGGKSIPIVEQFKETSQVSSSLLGVPRAETQLSLFSDVATYGLDTENWDASDIFIGHSNDPYQWYEKEHPVYGRRSNVRFYEGSDEQALYLSAFPTQYTYPKGSKENKIGQGQIPLKFKNYMNFVALGRYLYNLFISVNPVFANRNFLSEEDATIVDVEDNVILDFTFDKAGSVLDFNTKDTWYDVKYGKPLLQTSFDAIERWTVFYDKIIARTDGYPKMPATLIALESDPEGRIAIEGYKAFGEYNLIRAFCSSSDTIPGDSSSTTHYGILQSKRSFRYQPGRSSGFTFGARMIAGSAIAQDQIAEWGCSNNTDEYMFQLKGSSFSIIRRSTVKMPDELLERQGLSANDQSSTQVTQYGIGTDSRLWETVIRRDAWNGDKLQGDGDSGYILSFEDVTMYKIEFSWYGAIGAKFYAYVPIENDECRWVLLHTFVIENGLGEPVLENPDFKFRYLIYTSDTKDIREPMYLYKYGSSCYIDGGDEGTIRLNSVGTTTKEFDTRTSILGILPKETLSNTQGEDRQNYKKSYPDQISVSSDTFARIDIEEVNGSPMGVHFNYSPGIWMNGKHPKTRKVVAKYTNSGLGELNRIALVQPESSPGETGSNDIADGAGQPKFPLVNDRFSVDLTQDSNIVSINSGALIKTFDTLQVGDCLYMGSDPITQYKIKKFTNQRPLQNVTVTNVTGHFTCDARKIRLGERFEVSGTDTDSAINDYPANQVFEVTSIITGSSGNSVTAFKLSNLNGNNITSSVGGTTGLTFTTSDLKEYDSENKTSIVLTSNYVHNVDANGALPGNGITNQLAYLKRQLNVSTGSSNYALGTNNDYYAHVIADGVYGISIGEDGGILKRNSNGINSKYNSYSYALEESVAEDTRKLDGSIFRIDDAKTNPQKFFEASLVNYNTVVSSDIGITKNKFKIHFLNARKLVNSGKQFAEFLLGVTPHKPFATTDRDDSDPEVKFEVSTGEYVEYNRDDFPSVEFCHYNTDFDERDRVGLGEWDPSYGDRLQVDPRLDQVAENKLEGEDIGNISCVAGEVGTINYAFEEIVLENDSDGIERSKIVFAEGGSYPSSGEIKQGTSEVGVNFAGTGFFYTSDVIVPTIEDEENTSPYIYAEQGLLGHLETYNPETLTGANGTPKVIQTKTITLKDNWRAFSLDENGDRLFRHKEFSIVQAVSFSDQPLYPVFALSDDSRIDGIVIEEISEQGIVTTHTPNFVHEDVLWNDNLQFPAQPFTTSTNTPTAFNGDTGLSACRYDETLLNPLRPGQVIYSYYVGANDTVAIGLSNIFQRDRKDISRGALNNKAVFITATKVDPTADNGNIQLTITSREQ